MDLIKLFQKLLNFKSITPNDDGAFDFIDEYMGKDWECIKLDIEDTKNRFYYKKFTENNQHLCFAGHIDVVPTGSGWSVDPFEAKIINGKIIARGAQDMKSGVAAFLHACKNTQAFNGTLSILLTSDEEGEGTNGTIKVLEYLKEIDLLPTYSIVAEPTCEDIFGDAIKVGRRGSINGYIELQGKQGHAAYPEKSINPIELIAPVLEKIAGVNLDNGDEYFAPSKLVITDIRSGMQVTNVTPDKLNLMFNVRNSTKTTKEDVEKFIDSMFKNFDFSLKLTQGSYPFITNKESQIVTLITSSIKNVININTKHSTAGGTSDARLLSAFGIETVEFGVLNNTIHGIDENTTLNEVENLKEIFVDVIKRF